MKLIKTATSKKLKRVETKKAGIINPWKENPAKLKAVILNPGIRMVTRNIIKTSIAQENIPNVKRFIGNVRMRMIGFTKRLMSVNAIPAKNKVLTSCS